MPEHSASRERKPSTSITLDSAILVASKERARRLGLSYSDYIAHLVRIDLAERPKLIGHYNESGEPRSFRVAEETDHAQEPAAPPDADRSPSPGT